MDGRDHLERDPGACGRQNRPMRSFTVLALSLLMALAAGDKISAQVSGVGPAPQTPPAMSDAEFQSLVDKSNLYVKAINALGRVKQSYDRYRSWVDLKKGPTGKEPYITYGLYELNSSEVDRIRDAASKGPTMPPPIPAADAAIQKLAAAVTELAPLVKKASTYYEQQDFKDDGARRGQEMHAQMMPLFASAFAAEAELRQAMDPVKARVDRQQLAEIEKKYGKNYQWHLRNYMLAAKALVELVPDNTNAPVIDVASYKARYDVLEAAYNGFDDFTSQHPDEVKKVLLASFVDSAVKDYFGASKFLRRTLETPKMDKREYVKRVNELIEKYNALIQRTNSL